MIKHQVKELQSFISVLRYIFFEAFFMILIPVAEILNIL